MRDTADDQVFIIRCWNERRDAPGKPAQWRMRVIHLNRDHEVHFNDPTAIVDFIASRLADAGTRGRNDAPG